LTTLFFLYRCKKDSTLQYDFKADKPLQQFGVRAFRFITGSTNDVYLHCKVEVCREGDGDSNCAKGCRSGSRRRRSLASDASSTTLTIGLIKVTQNANAQSGKIETFGFYVLRLHVHSCHLIFFILH
jgi:hypothetical protein